MHKVYTPPSKATSWPLTVIGAMLLTLCILLVLPLTQMISSGLKKNLEITRIDTAAPPPPPETFEMETPPPPEQEEPEPQPELTERTQQLSLSELDLDLGLGSGGFLKSALNRVDDATQGLEGLSLFDIADLDKAPARVSTPSPRYPPELRKEKIPGSVVLVFVVNEEGRVEDPRVESSSRVEFEQPALAAIRRWRFKPGMKDGEPVRTHVRQPIQFKIGT